MIRLFVIPIYDMCFLSHFVLLIRPIVLQLLPVRQIYEVFDLLYDVLSFMVLVPIWIGFAKWHLLSRSERWVVAFLLALLLHEVFSQLFWRLHVRNHFLYYIQTVTVLFSVAGVYGTTIGPRHLPWKIAIIVSLSILAEVILGVGFNHINSVTLTLSRVLPATYSFIALNRLFSDKKSLSLTLNPMVYLHLGFFLFGSFTAINVCFKSYFIENSLDFYYLFNTLSAMICAVAFSLFSVGFLRIRSVNMT